MLLTIDPFSIGHDDAGWRRQRRHVVDLRKLLLRLHLLLNLLHVEMLQHEEILLRLVDLRLRKSELHRIILLL